MAPLRLRPLASMRTAIALVAILASCLPTSSGSETGADTQTLWLTTSHALLRVGLNTGDVQRTTALVAGAEQAVVSVRGGRFYTADGSRLAEYDVNANMNLSAGKVFGLPFDHVAALAVDEAGESVWVASGLFTASPTLIALDGQLNSQWQYALPAPAVDMVAAVPPAPDATEPATAVWVLHRDGVTGLSTGGAETVTLDRKVFGLGLPRALAAVPVFGGQQLWIATTLGVRAVDERGEVKAKVPLLGIRALHADGQGGAWAVAGHRIIHLAAGLVVDARFGLLPMGHPGAVRAAVADPRDASLWFVSGRTLLHAFPDSRLENNADLRQYLGLDYVTDAVLYVDTLAPTLTLKQPPQPLVSADATPTLVFGYDDPGLGIDPGSLKITRGGEPFAADCGAPDTGAHTVTCHLGPLDDGHYVLEATIADRAGNVSEPVQADIEIDTVAPTITIGSPQDGSYTNADSVAVTGKLSETAQLTLNGHAVGVDADYHFSDILALTADGPHAIDMVATDPAGNRSTRTLTIYRDTAVPSQAKSDGISAGTGVTPDTVQVEGTAGTVEADANVTVTNSRTGDSVTVQATDAGSFAAAIPGDASDTFEVTVSDRAGNRSDPTEVSGTSGAIPPDSADVAPPLPDTGSPPLVDRVSFLYEGSNPIQTGVAPGTIEARRVSIVRGSVTDRTGQPLAGVNITVLNHPELGATRTQADGGFDLAVNGGGTLTVVYQADGYLPVQRTLKTQWNDWYHADPVVMTPLDEKVTVVDLTSDQPIQIARGSVVEDADGRRQATLMFPRGTTATIITPDGGTQQLSQLDVRLTEYTGGANGPQAMPAQLPPSSAYTYAVELSVDQARAQGVKVDGKEVQFNQAVPFYVNNFLNFPVGESVPMGYYDSDKAAWVPYHNGRIIQVLSEQDGLAVLDVTGSGQPATAAELQALGITDAERTQLAQLYDPGDSLWRVALDHLSTWDCNWPYGPPRDAERPDVDLPKTPDEPKDSDEEDDCTGCRISPQAQAVGEEIPIAGTPFSLHYQSNRAPEYHRNRVTIPLTDGDIPTTLLAVNLDVYIAGQHFTKTFPPTTNQSYTFAWDGKDGFGRAMVHSANAHILLTYVYGCVYYGVSGGNAFGRFGNIADPLGTRSRCQGFAFSRTSSVVLESPLAPVLAAGNWSLSIEHYWDGRSRALLRGDGQRRTLGTPIIETVAGTGEPAFSGDGGPATKASLFYPEGVATGADGSLYIADSEHYRVRRVAPDGTITTVAGTGEPGFSGDGGAAVEAKVLVWGITVGADGSLYISGGARIRRVAPNGVITTVAGTGTAGFSGDGGPATEANLAAQGMALGPDGSLYVADFSNNRIRRVAPDGIITTVAGSGDQPEGGYWGDGGPATDAELQHPTDVAVGPDGSLYIADSQANRIRRVGPDGIITTFAGSGSPGIWGAGFSGDGGLATRARLNLPTGVAIGADGTVYIGDWNNHRIRRVAPDGIITTVAGGGDGAGDFSGDGGPATAAELWSPGYMAIGGDGSLYVADTFNYRIRRVASAAVGHTADGKVVIPSANGTHAFIFDTTGRHLRTISTRTGAVLYQFTRDADGRLIAITDGAGNTTTIERDGSGQATAIVAPDGQRTELLINANGHLTQVTGPGGISWSMAYTTDGLLTRFTDRSGSINTFAYNSEGRLIRDVGPAGNGWTLARTELSQGYRVDMTSGAGRLYQFALERPQARTRRYTNIAPDGAATVRTQTDAGDASIKLPGGTTISSSAAPDPRFSVQAAFVEQQTVTTPSGLTRTIQRDRTAMAAGERLLSPEQLTRSITVNGRTTHSIFDGASRTWTTTTAAGRKASLTTDALDRPLSRQIGNLAPMSFTYDSRGRPQTLTRGAGDTTRSIQFSYHTDGAQAGYLQSITDSLGRTTTFEHDAVGRVTRQTLPDGRTVGYQYDAAGRLIALTPPGRSAHVFEYNDLDQRSSYTPPDLDGVETITRYTYNADKQLTAIERPGGDAVTFDYDAGGRLSTRTTAADAVTYGYDATTGQIATIDAPGGISLSFGYDGFLPTQTTWAGPIAGSVTRSFDDNFWLTGETVGGQAVAFAYDADGLLTSAGALTLTRDAANGLITATSLATVADRRGYNAFGELTGRTVTASGTTPYAVDYTRDALGRITGKTETVAGVTHTWAYLYDPAGRLAQVNRDGSTVHLYTYDANGNRIGHTGPSGSETGTYDVQDRLQTYAGATYNHNAAGQRTGRTTAAGTTSYDYEAVGNLRGVTLADGTRIDYLIDGRDRRIGKQINGTLQKGWLYRDRLNPVAQLDASGHITQRYVYADKPNVPAYMIQDGVTYRIVSDQLGSVRLVINTQTGEIAQRIDYSPFGKVITDTNPGFQPFGFAGGLYDPETGLVRFGARDYDPETGRWTGKDPIFFAGGQANLYGYVVSNPVNLIDPSGLTDLAAVEISLGAQVGFDGKIGPVGISGVINVGSINQSTAYSGARLVQEFGGGVSVDDVGLGLSTIRSENFPGESLTSVPFEGPNVAISLPGYVPGASADLTTEEGDFVIGFGLQFVAGLEFQLNLSEAGRRIGRSLADWMHPNQCPK